MTGLFGIGGGFLIIPALVVLLGLDMATAIGTSLVIVVLNSASGLAAHLTHAHLDLPITAAFGIAAVLAALVAARISERLPASRLQGGFGVLVIGAAVFVAVQAA